MAYPASPLISSARKAGVQELQEPEPVANKICSDSGITCKRRGSRRLEVEVVPVGHLVLMV
jgi:hypothetical protein